MPLRIGIIAHVQHCISEPFAGGLEAHTAYLAKALAKRGHAVTLFCAGDDTPNQGTEYFCRPTAQRLQTGDGGFAYEHHAYRNLMRALRGRNFDIIHNNALHYLPIAMADQLPCPMVTTLHTPPFWEMAGSIQLSPHPNSVFVAVSEFIREIWSAVADVDCVIPNGVDLDKFPFQPAPGPEPYWFWSGRIVPEKGLHLAIEAARLANMPLRFAGPAANPGYFQSRIQPHLNQDTRYLGHLSQQQLTPLMGGAKACLCTPIWEEPYGLVVAEALACGTPVAGFARGALPALIDGKSGILAEPGNAEALAAAAIAVQSLSRQDCRQRAETICDAGRMIEGYEVLYHRLRAALTGTGSTGTLWYGDLLSRQALRSHYLRNLPADFSEVA